MKNYTTVTVEVEFSASDIRKFTERVNANCQCPTSQAIANVKAKLRDTVKYHHLLNYWAY
jgi:hypothetical protein